MKGALWRLLLVHYEEIILSSVKELPRRAKLRPLYSYLSEIQCIAYALPHAQQNKQVRL